MNIRMLKTSHYKARNHLFAYGRINCFDLDSLLSKDYTKEELFKIGGGSTYEGLRRIKRKLANLITKSGLNVEYIYGGIRTKYLEESILNKEEGK